MSWTSCATEGTYVSSCCCVRMPLRGNLCTCVCVCTYVRTYIHEDIMMSSWDLLHDGIVLH